MDADDGGAIGFTEINSDTDEKKVNVTLLVSATTANLGYLFFCDGPEQSDIA